MAPRFFSSSSSSSSHSRDAPTPAKQRALSPASSRSNLRDPPPPPPAQPRQFVDARAHPYGGLVASVTTTQDDDEECPVCCEALALRLPGEKPHIVPSCGHRLHEVCFEAVYGSVARAKMRGVSVGLCGICRKDMKLGDDGGGGGAKKNKLAALHGDLGPAGGMDSHKMRSVSNRTLARDDDDDENYAQDLQADDDLVQLPPASVLATTLAPPPGAGYRASTNTSSTGSTLTAGRRGSADTMKAGSSNSSGGRGAAGSVVDSVVSPVIIVRSEHSSMPRSSGNKPQHLTCMVTVEMPPRWPIAPLQPSAIQEEPLPAVPERRIGSYERRQSLAPTTMSDPTGGNRPSSPTPSSVYSAYAYGSTQAMAADPLAPIVADLQARMADWKGHSLEDFGILKLFSTLSVRKDQSTREFIVYLFEEAILCVADDKKKGLAGKIVDGISGGSDAKLRLKGRVYARHIRAVVDSSTEDDLSLTVKMSDDALDEFCMCFNDRATHETWRAQIEAIVSAHQTPATLPPPPPAPSSGMGRDSGSSNGLSRSAGSIHSTELGSESSRSAAHSSAFSGYTRTTATSAPLSSTIHEEEDGESKRYSYDNVSSYSDPYPREHSYPLYRQPTSGSAAHVAAAMRAASNYTPLDLMLILSVPTSGLNNLKLSIIRNTLDFLVHNSGPRTRLSLVTYSVGDGLRGSLHKTPFIALGTEEGRARFNAVIDEIGSDGEGVLMEHKEDRVSVVTAVNVALDIILQRKAKSALTGVVLMNDGPDGTQKQQMDLVKVRAEAAKVPIHTIGWGRSQDPQSLWLLSNSTGGSHTFCKGFYELKDTIVGVVGGFFSIAATHLHVHISVPERRWFQIRKVTGTSKAIVSADGKDADIDLGELRFGERRDLIVEVEMTLGDSFTQKTYHEGPENTQTFNTATDAFFLDQVGINPTDFSPQSHFYEETLYDDLPDEVPLFEVNAAYKDPAAGKTISRLRQSPCLLTINLTPPSTSTAPRPTSSPEIVRRRMELLCTDMIARSLLYMSRRQDQLAQRLLSDTKRIIATIMDTLAPTAANPARRRSSYMSAHSVAYATLRALQEDVSSIMEATYDRSLFDGCHRFIAAQHAVILRSQQAWTSHTAVERLFFTADMSRRFVELSKQYISQR
ncbi:von Willebrand RING finger domain-containing protein [Pseudohyphozyma bogoriensis]|nr:von Willebrand RING finger domain-containing protein [Pseudohyphozyma bogoriensis]